ncbi:Glycosyl transferase, family 39 (fragment) [Candidatus Sulfopaludibacter sp. SbA3]
MAPIVSAYCARHRGNELILAAMDDDLYASTLPLARLRYALIEPPSSDEHYAMDFASMGIILTAAQFNHLADRESGFRRRLAEWGIDSAAPIGTLIVARSLAELSGIVKAHPASDFLMPNRYLPAAASDAHVLIDAAPGHFFLLSRSTLPAPPPRWSCGL